MNKKLKIQIVLLVTIITVGIVVINHNKSMVNYMNEPCPICGYDEVLDFGYDNINGQEHGHCTNCKKDFFIDVEQKSYCFY